MNEIQNSVPSFILGFLEKSARWVTPKEITQARPNFKRYYRSESLDRIVRLELKKLVDEQKILKHRFQHGYYHSREFKLEEIRQIGDYLKHLDITGNFTLSEILSLDPTKMPIVDSKAKK